MQRNVAIFLGLLLLAVCLCGCSKTQLEDKNAEIDALKQQVAALRGEIRSLSDTNTEIQAEVERLRSEAEDAKAEIAKHADTASALPDETSTKKVAELERESDTLRAELQNRVNQIAELKAMNAAMRAELGVLTQQLKSIMEQSKSAVE